MTRETSRLAAWTRFFASLAACIVVMMTLVSWNTAAADAEYWKSENIRKDKEEAQEDAKDAKLEKQAAVERQKILDELQKIRTAYNGLIIYLRNRGDYIPPEYIIESDDDDNGTADRNEHSSSSNSDRSPSKSVSPAPVKNGGGGGGNSDQRRSGAGGENSGGNDKGNSGGSGNSNGGSGKSNSSNAGSRSNK